MVTAAMCRIHQSGRLDLLSADAWKQVAEGIRVYKEIVRKHTPEAVPFYPLGLSDVTNAEAALALGMRSAEQRLLGVWRIDGPAAIKIPWAYPDARLLYPRDLGIQAAVAGGSLRIEFPRKRMACLLSA
jgi:hypothetical protein